jgi:hypothetical protein
MIYNNRIIPVVEYCHLFYYDKSIVSIHLSMFNVNDRVRTSYSMHRLPSSIEQDRIANVWYCAAQLNT